jgi:hypothetical protein
MIRPTRRTVLIFLTGIPLALLTVIYDPALWAFSFDYAAFVLLAALSDVALALPPRLLEVKLQIPDKLHIGEQGALTVTIQPTRLRRGARFHITAEQRGDTEPAAVVSADLPAGQGARITLPVVPKRRGQVHVVQIWMRWRGSLGLVEFIRRIRADRTIDVLLVGILTFGLGLAAGIPTVLLSIYQGLPLGAMLALHYNRDLAVDFLGWLSIHGTTELTALTLFAAGGFVIAEKILFPGRYSRLDNLSIHGRQAAQMAAGAVLMLFVAAILEGGFRQLVQSTGLRFATGLAVGAVWLAYFCFAGREARP